MSRLGLVSLFSLVLTVHVAPDALGAWEPNGTAICTAAGIQSYPEIALDGAGGGIVVWHDNRSGNWDIYAQRVDASGTVLWTSDGIAICTAAGDQTYPVISPDGSGGTIIAWRDPRGTDYDIYAQRVDGSGITQWTADGLAICTAVGDQDNPRVTSDGAGGAIISWRDLRNGNYDIYAQRVSALGATLWTTDGVAICTTKDTQLFNYIVSDGSGGAIIAWPDERSGITEDDIYGQRIDASGAVLWTIDGVPICTATGSQGGLAMVSDDAGGAILSWTDTRNGSDYDIYAQRINSMGAVQWAADGVAISATTGHQRYSCIVSDGTGGAIIGWADSRSDTNDVFAQRISAMGTVQWTADGVAVCTAAGSQGVPRNVSDGSSGSIFTWVDERSGDYDVYAQRLNNSGMALWSTDGVALCTAADEQIVRSITSDGAGGAIATWWDEQGSTYDIYAQRVTHKGIVLGNVVPVPSLVVIAIATTLGMLGLTRLGWRAQGRRQSR